MKVKNIMFSGVMAAILGATGANAAINVASQGYVDSKVGAVETNITNNYLSKTDAAGTYVTTQYVTENITNVLGDETAGLVADVAKAQAAADKAQGEVDDLEEVVATKANAADVYTKEEANGLLDAKQDEIQLGANLMWGEDGKLTTTGIATNDSFDNLERDVNTLKGDATQEGSVAYDIAEALKTYSTTEQVKALDAETLQSAKDYADGLADNYDAAGSAAAVEAKLADYTKTSELDATFATDAELDAVDAKFANYTTTEGLTTKLADYALQTSLDAEKTARETADAATTEALKAYTKTTDLDAGFVSESEMTSFKTDNSAAIADAKKAGTDAQATADANAEAISGLESDLTTKITMPEVCATTNCVLSTIGGTVQWVPLTEPLQ